MIADARRSLAYLTPAERRHYIMFVVAPVAHRAARHRRHRPDRADRERRSEPARHRPGEAGHRCSACQLPTFDEAGLVWLVVIVLGVFVGEGADRDRPHPADGALHRPHRDQERHRPRPPDPQRIARRREGLLEGPTAVRGDRVDGRPLHRRAQQRRDPDQRGLPARAGGDQLLPREPGRGGSDDRVLRAHHRRHPVHHRGDHPPRRTRFGGRARSGRPTRSATRSTRSARSRCWPSSPSSSTGSRMPAAGSRGRLPPSPSWAGCRGTSWRPP